MPTALSSSHYLETSVRLSLVQRTLSGQILSHLVLNALLADVAQTVSGASGRKVAFHDIDRHRRSRDQFCPVSPFSHRDWVSAGKEYHTFCYKDPVNERNTSKPVPSTWASVLRSSGNHSGS
jgi:hypothetical protein